MNAARQAFRRSLAQPGVIAIPAAYDGFSALLTARAGFPAVYMTGNGMSGSVLGLPDVGLMTLNDVANVARSVAAAVDVPVIVDADTGYGNAVNVYHTVKTLENAGAAAIQLEDQVNPKRCGHMPGKREVVDFDEAVGKIAAAVAARQDPDFAIIARTDASGALGIGEAIRRANAFLAEGADIAFVECPGTPEELEAIGRDVRGPTIVNQDEAGESAKFSIAELAKFGLKIAIYPGILRYSACYGMQWALEILKQDGNTARARERMISFKEYNDILGIDAIKDIEARFMRGGRVPA